ncbi:ABC transporter permease [Paenibacillus thiaminolyticus]|uniref:ABC transporter permease n=1 Tax=Paenibacillus thiaminolyticus TaxID=49283 RepID=A0AAP9DU21_PANTH|nr:ABC transporter permease [Paenibacillus thiaminolyticus]MCY9537567.1 ABC transporter permease [Paenibacillus thiaminolyticus]MCY9600680.1 ABC transporter permease [Paenibacillus thiaminolyticus]MCY9607508.1 ABC transporter permease [Paenibacillus thiaminolyticus]MCY9611308.1 ABC transporter permease [Paenibacillus thiaminolyticus]MCY9619400.1 ABC transporter permease [Paenibacillus thiaminolyticus]
MHAALRSEKTKFFSYGWCVLGAVGAIIIPLLYLLTSDTPKTGREQEVLSLCLQALYLGQHGVIVASAGYFGQEYSHSALRTTLLTQPSRLKLLCAKFVNMSIIILVTGIVSSVIGLIVLMFQHDIEWTGSFMIRLLGSISLGILSWIQLAWITSALSIMTKSFIAPVAIMLPLVLGLSHMLFSFSQLAKFLPTLATMNLFSLPAVNVYLDKWPGLAVQFSWVVLLLTISAWLFSYRSVR